MQTTRFIVADYRAPRAFEPAGTPGKFVANAVVSRLEYAQSFANGGEDDGSVIIIELPKSAANAIYNTIDRVVADDLAQQALDAGGVVRLPAEPRKPIFADMMWAAQ